MSFQMVWSVVLLMGHAVRSDSLRLEQELDDLVNVVSLGELKLTCRIRGAEDFVWLYMDAPITDEQGQIEIKNMPSKFTSRLTINPVTTVDGGKYTCCGNAGDDSVCTSSKVIVSFNASPIDSNPLPAPREELCYPYPDESNGICRSWLKGSQVHAETIEGIAKIESQISRSISSLSAQNLLSSRCRDYAPRAFCHFLLPTCSSTNSLVRLCRADCEMLRNSFCDGEFRNFSSSASSGSSTSASETSMIMSTIANRFVCSKLPTVDDQCTSIGLPSVLNTSHSCYDGIGLGYRGNVAESVSKKECLKWEDIPKVSSNPEYKKYVPANFAELSGGHRYCRNPINQKKYPEAMMDSPWCFVSQEDGSITAEACHIENCPSNDTLPKEALMILLPSIAVSLVLGILAISYWLCRRRNPKDAKQDHQIQNNRADDAAMMNPYQTGNLTGEFGQNIQKMRIPELPANSVVLKREIGEAYYGTVYLAEIVPNLVYAPAHPVAAKSLADESNTAQIHQFWREIEMLSEMRHDRIANLRAVVMQPKLRAMLFEYTDLGDLKNFLLSRNPHSDMGVVSGPSFGLEQQFDICHQICQGMEFLSSGERPYVHRDLAARNVLIDSRLNIKISNIGIARAETTSDYFNPQLASDNEPTQTLIPVRWMSPESLLQADYTTASDIWSYAVCCWEVFSFGTQPFCGYSNEEVMELVIHRKQVLPCPETCPLQIYNLLINCWSYSAMSRPTFSKIVLIFDQIKRSQFQGPRKQYSSASTALASSGNARSQRNTNHHNNDMRSHVSRNSSTEHSVVMPGPGSIPASPPPYESSWKASSVRESHLAPPASPVSSHAQSSYRYPTGTRSTTGSSADSSAVGNTFPIPEELLRPLLPNNQNFVFKNNLQQR